MSARYWVEKILKRCKREPARMGDILVEGFQAAIDHAVARAEEILTDKDQEIQSLKELLAKEKADAQNS